MFIFDSTKRARKRETIGKLQRSLLTSTKQNAWDDAEKTRKKTRKTHL